MKLAENFDGRTFAIFIKHLNELKKDGEELTHFGPDTRLCSHEKLKDSENYLLCKECVIENAEEEMISHSRAFDAYIEKNATKNI